jgi:ATP-dependent protease ClpP protease subunit
MKKEENYESLDDKIYSASDPFVETTYQTYKDLLKDRTILLNGEIKENIIERVVMQINKLAKEHPATPIHIVLNSYGGSTFDAQAVVDTIRSTKTPIITKVLGKAMSAAFDIFLAGDLRIVLGNSVVMCHCGAQDLENIKLSDSIDEAKFTSELFKRWAKYYASRTKMSEKEWLNLLKSGKDRYFFPEECVDLEIAHQIEEYTDKKHNPRQAKVRKLRKQGKKKAKRKSRKRKK